MYANLYVCMCVCFYVCICVYICILICMCMVVYVCMCVGMYVFESVSMCVCMCVCVCMYVRMYVCTFYIYISLSMHHTPLYCVILHESFVLVHGYMINYNGGFLLLDVLAFALRPVQFSFSKSILLAYVANCFRYFFTNSYFHPG